MSYRVRHRRPNKSGPMVKLAITVLSHTCDNIYNEHDVMGYAPSKSATFAAARPNWTMHWAVIHIDSGYILRSGLRKADSARVVVERMQRYWSGCDWDTLMNNNEQVHRDLYYKRDEYRLRSLANPNLYWNTGLESWVEPDQATVWNAEQKALVDPTLLPIPGEWEIV